MIKSFANFHLGQDILKQVLTQLLLYYTRFLDLVKTAYPNGAPFAKFILSIPTLMGEIRNFAQLLIWRWCGRVCKWKCFNMCSFRKIPLTRAHAPQHTLALRKSRTDIT